MHHPYPPNYSATSSIPSSPPNIPIMAFPSSLYILHTYVEEASQLSKSKYDCIRQKPLDPFFTLTWFGSDPWSLSRYPMHRWAESGRPYVFMEQLTTNESGYIILDYNGSVVFFFFFWPAREIKLPFQTFGLFSPVSSWICEQCPGSLPSDL